MANNEILPFAGTDTGTNLLTQAEYNADSQRPIGNQPGVARSKLVNKVLRQTSLIASAIAQYFANRQSNDITDSLSAATLAGYMLNAIGGDTQKNSFNSAIAAGTADAITASYTPAVAALTNGLSLYVRAGSANATTTPTFTPNSGTIAAKAIVKGNGQALAKSDIAGGGHWIELQYDASLDKWVLLNPASGINALGFGQTAQNVLASRAWSTAYTNTTGRPIFICVAGTVGSANAAIRITIDGSAVFDGTSAWQSAVQTISSAMAIIPPGSTYTVGVTSGLVGTLFSWSELR